MTGLERMVAMDMLLWPLKAVLATVRSPRYSDGCCFFLFFLTVDPSLVPVAGYEYKAREIDWHGWERPAATVCGVVLVGAVVLVAAVVPTFPAGTHQHCTRIPTVMFCSR